jgi:hypothetical protein
MLEEAEEDAVRTPDALERIWGTLIEPVEFMTLDAAAPMVIVWLKPDPLLTPVRLMEGMTSPENVPSVRKDEKPFIVVGTSL